MTLKSIAQDFENKVINQYQYQNKSWGEKICDALLSPLRYAWEGKTITCLSDAIGGMVKSEEKSRIEFKQSREQKGAVHQLLRVCAGVASVVLLPLTGLAIAGKALVAENNLLRQRYMAKQGDKFTFQDRAANRVWCQCVEGIAKHLSYSQIQQAAHMQADEQMAPWKDPIRIVPDMTESDIADLRSQQGGLFFMSAKMLRKQLEKYTDQGDEIKKALKMAREYESWSLHMLSVMPSRFIPVDLKGLIKDIAMDMKDRLNALEKGESFLVPVNLRPMSGGFHTITVGFKKQDNGNFSLTVYNLGLGCDNHQRDRDEQGKERAYPFRILNIDPTIITNINRLTDFIDYATFKEKDTDSAKGWYSFLRQSPWGAQAQIDPPHDKRTEVELALPSSLHRSGICIWKSALEAIKDHISPMAYKTFAFAMKRDNVAELYEHYLAKDIRNEARDLKAGKVAPWKGDKQQARILVEIGIDEYTKRLAKKPRVVDQKADLADLAKFDEMKQKIQAHKSLVS